MLLAADDPFAAYIDGFRVLHLLGTNASEQLVAEIQDEKGQIVVSHSSAAGTGASREAVFLLADFDRLNIMVAGGDDFVNIVDPAQTLDAAGKVLSLDAGAGDNTVVLTHAPFPQDTARKLASLLDLSQQIESLASRVAEATSAAVKADAIGLVERVRVSLADVSQTLATEAESQLFEPARDLVERGQGELVDLGHSLVDRLEALAERSEALMQELTQEFEREVGLTPPDNGRESPRASDVEPDADRPGPTVTEPDWARAAAEQLTQDGLALGNEAQDRVSQAGTEVANAAAVLAQRAAVFEQQAGQLAGTGDDLAAQGESQLTAATDRVLTVIAELKAFAGQLEQAGRAVLEEIAQAAAISPAAKQKAGGGACQVSPTQFFVGGPGFDFFFPISAPTQSWYINGGAGFNILFGGLAADEIQGGPNTDVVFGLSGNDLIHGNGGVDLLFGEFAIDLPALTGNDCVYGDDDVDLVVGDNFLEIVSFGTTAGGDDNLQGGKGVDLVFGDDVLDVFDPTHAGGQDVMAGGDDIDALFGTGGDDTIHGNDDIDLAMGNGGNDLVYGDTGRNVTMPWSTVIHIGNLLLGNLGDDQVYGDKGVDVIFGNDGQDSLYGGDQFDVMFGGADDDLMYGDAGGQIATIASVPVRIGNVMFGGSENDKMWSGGDLDFMHGNDGDDELHGYDGNFQPLGIDADLLFGGNGDDQLEGDNESLLLVTSLDWMFGGDGDDTLDGGAQPDFMLGGDQNDTLRGDSNSVFLVASADLMFGGNGLDTMDGGNSLDVMFGGNQDDTMQGDNEAVLLVSPDVMFGGQGQDTMNGGSSVDFVFGEGQADRLTGDSNNLALPLSADFLFGGTGADDMDGGNGLDFLFGGDDGDTLRGDNSTFGELSPDFLFGEQGSDDMDGGANADFLYGGTGDDTMTGDVGLGWMVLSIDMLYGNEDCDTMRGGRAADFMFGNSGIDRMDGQWGPDVMSGGDNSDTMNGGDLPDVIMGDDANDLIHGDDGLDVIFGGLGADCLYGDNGPDLMSGGDGNDCMRGGNGVDWMSGNDGDDLLLGDAGADFLFGNDGNDKLDGGSGYDVINGGPGNDTLWGGPQSAWLIGGSGSDTKYKKASSGLDCNCQLEVCPRFDFGDAPNSYGTLLPTGPQHLVTGPRLGSLIDIEADGIPSVGATGDDASGAADEDGVTITGLMVGSVATAQVFLSNASSARLDAWIDFNLNGVFDPAEQIFSSAMLLAGANPLTFAVPVTAVAGSSYARFRVSTGGGLGPTGLAGPGEVEDYRVTVEPPRFDFGDAANSYVTLLLSNGPRHLPGGPRLGNLHDTESNGAPTGAATGDDAGGVDDEDGVVLVNVVVGGVGVAYVTLNGAGSASLDAWIDFNINGMFDPSEQVFASTAIVSGSNVLPFAVPFTASLGPSVARFRVSTTGSLGPTGFGGVGEIEDHRVTIQRGRFDFGDAPNSYSTLLASNGPRHAIAGPRLGSLIDDEWNGTPLASATGDDASGSDDEDGVVLPTLIAGGTATATVTLSNALSARLDAWVDFNLNGVFDHPSEQVLSSTPLAVGVNAVPFPVPLTATAGVSYARFRVSSNGGLTPIGYGGLGEVEDYRIAIEKLPQLDFGDAPNTYSTLLGSNGPRHTIAGPRLGSLIDAEANGAPSVGATGDDTASVDDEDGVAMSSLIPGGTATVAVVLSNASSARLDAWIDFNANGVFDHPTEQIFSSVALVSGTNSLTFPVPVTAIPGGSYARFRVSSSGGLTPVGFGGAGEVEDYRVGILQAQELDFGDAPNTYSTLLASNGPRHTVGGPRLGSLIDIEANGAPSIGAVGDDTAGVNDEEGVAMTTLLPGGTTTVAAVLSNAAAAQLDAWIDFNGNGVFDHPAEQIFAGAPLVAGANTLTFSVPVTAVPGGSYARFRVSSSGGLTPVGFGGAGEVEDYRVGILQAQELDFGDAPDSYGTLLASNGARHTIGGPRLGSSIDVEPNGNPTFGATGDDWAALDDEDGVVFGGLFIGGSGTVTVALSNAVAAQLDAWVDFNLNGVFDHPSEQILASAGLVAGANTLTFSVPVTAVLAVTHARFRVSVGGGLTPTGLGGAGEVEDYEVAVERLTQLDFGDAPKSYLTLLADNGARHVPGGPMLGTVIDVEGDGNPSTLADGDDLLASDDEEGVTLPPAAIGGMSKITVFVSGALTGLLDAWMDFNQNGLFDPSEQIFTSVVVSAGTNNLAYSVPATALNGLTFARFRISSTGGLTPSGLAADGEVEDYWIDLFPPPPATGGLAD